MAGNRMRGGLKLGGALVVLVVTSLGLAPAGGPPAEAEPQGIFKLEHLIFIVQENRTFDHYFGTYPGARGIPTKPNGSFKPCLPHPVLKKCSRPFRTNNPVNLGGPHSHWAAVQSIAGGKMNGFVEVAGKNGHGEFCVQNPTARRCRKFNGPQHQPDVMSVMGRDDIPNYWDYADNFVLQDMFFEGVDSWSLPAHMYLMSAWAASCPMWPAWSSANLNAIPSKRPFPC